MNLITQTYDAGKWRLAPKVATDYMTYIGQLHRYNSIYSIGGIYRAMIDIAPQPETLSPWRSIESAPKDGTEFLSFGVYGVHVTYWDCIEGGGHPENGPAIYWWCSDTAEFINGPADCPTHWMPLPQPPEVE